VGCIVIARVRQRSALRRRAADPVASLDDDETSPLEAGDDVVDSRTRAADETTSTL
jgi:hypothetical protein